MTREVNTALGRFFVPDNDLIGRHIESGKPWEPWVLEALMPHLRSDAWLVEIGAHVGVHTVQILPHVRNVLAIEPICHELLAMNAWINGQLPRVIIKKFAAYSVFCQMGMAPADNQLTNLSDNLDEIDSVGSLALVPNKHGNIVGVPLDGELDCLEKICAIKSDAQGCDLPALMGAEQAIRKHRPVIVLEYEAELAKLHGHQWKHYETWIDQIGYEWEPLGTDIDFICLPK